MFCIAQPRSTESLAPRGWRTAANRFTIALDAAHPGERPNMATAPRKTATKAKAKAQTKAKARAKAKPSPRAARTPARTAATRHAVDLRKLPDFAGLLVTARRKDLDALLDANRKSYAGLQSVVQRQVEALKNAVSEWRLVIKLLAEGGAKESLSKLDELALASFKMALNNIRDLAEMTARSQADAYEVISRRIREDVDEVTRLLEQK
jgi:phasin family protein